MNLWNPFRKSKNLLQKKIDLFSENFFRTIGDARDLYQESEKLRKVVTDENQAVLQSSSALEEISSMLGKTSESAGNLAIQANQARNAVDLGQQSISEISNSLEKIQKSNSSLSESLIGHLESLEKINETLSEIQNKTLIINDIVFQTKLLSFNASVEAARAGEHGRGFAVVAEEMGNLAISSGRASQEISKILTSSLESTSDIVNTMRTDLTQLMNQTNDNIHTGLESGSRGESSFSLIVSKVDQVAKLSEEISTATREQEIGVRQITESIHKLNNTSHELKNVAEKTLKTSIHLSENTENQKVQFTDIANHLSVQFKEPFKPFDFDAAIAAHIDWKMKLTKYLANPDRSLDPTKVCLDHTCALGTWLYGEGKKYESHPTFEPLRQTHAAFHKTAGRIITMIHEGNRSLAEQTLAPEGEYQRTSDRCVDLIRIMRDQNEKQIRKVA